jgi:hypothetical protein
VYVVGVPPHPLERKARMHTFTILPPEQPTKTQQAIERAQRATKFAVDKAAREEGRICACEALHLSTCTAV